MSRARVVSFTVASRLLEGNAQGDPAERSFPVWLPPGYDPKGTSRYPVVFVLAGYAGHGRLMVAEKTFAETLDQRLERLTMSGAMAPAIFVMPDCFTRLGGSQYVDSTATGPYESYLVREVIAAVDAEFRTDPTRRGVVGKSSGGYGALRLGLRFPDVFPVIASMSGDALFEYCYMPDFAALTTALDAHGGDVESYVASFFEKTRVKVPSSDFAAMSIIAMSSCYSPNPRSPSGFDLPITWPSGRLRDDVWQRWLAFDPVRMLEAVSVRPALRAAHVECGTRDEYRLLPGARVVRDLLQARGAEVHYSEFLDGHMGLDYRYDVVLPWLVERLAHFS